MNKDQIKGNWKQFKGEVKQEWGKLTNDDLDYIAGSRDKLEGKVQERYGIEREVAKKRVDNFYQKYD